MLQDVAQAMDNTTSLSSGDVQMAGQTIMSDWQASETNLSKSRLVIRVHVHWYKYYFTVEAWLCNDAIRTDFYKSIKF